MRAALALLAVALLAIAASACGGGSDNGDVTLTVAARNTPEETVIGEIYAQALRSAGYEVKLKTLSDSELIEGPLEKVRGGQISGYPEHFKRMLQKLFAIDNPPTDSEEAYRLTKEKLAEKGFTAFAPTPYSLSRPVGMLRKTAEENDLEGISDLKGVSEEMTLLGPTDCHISGVDCLGGMERRYGIVFEGISYTYTPKQIRERYEQLEKGRFDAAIVNSTEGRLATEGDKFVALYDDEGRFPADNVFFITSPEVIEEAGPDFEETILAAQEDLTLPTMQQLDAEIELEGKDPAEVAAGYLAGETPAAGESDETTATSESQEAAAKEEPIEENAIVNSVGLPGVGMVLIDKHNFTLYEFSRDKNGKPSCYGACAKAWPPLLTKERPTVSYGAYGDFAHMTKRRDGAMQVTYEGHPAYLYTGDKLKYEVHGEGIRAFGGVWRAIRVREPPG